MVKTLTKILGFSLLILMFAVPTAFMQAGDGNTSNNEPTSPQDASFQSRCDIADKLKFPPCASSPSECASQKKEVGDKKVWREPFNCLFIQEPIGGKTGYDLYVRTPNADKFSPYSLWYGEAIVGKASGPYQAILVFEEGKESQGPFGLLYNYLGLVYNFLSGIIIGFVILITVVGGIRITAAGGDQSKYEEGKKMIVKALIGMVLWFTASVILYTINPTFFAF